MAALQTVTASNLYSHSEGSHLPDDDSFEPCLLTGRQLPRQDEARASEGSTTDIREKFCWNDSCEPTEAAPDSLVMTEQEPCNHNDAGNTESPRYDIPHFFTRSCPEWSNDGTIVLWNTGGGSTATIETVAAVICDPHEVSCCAGWIVPHSENGHINLPGMPMSESDHSDFATGSPDEPFHVCLVACENHGFLTKSRRHHNRINHIRRSGQAKQPPLRAPRSHREERPRNQSGIAGVGLVVESG
jgi:hypothetical protein